MSTGIRKLFRLVGIMTVLSYMIVILSTWIIAKYQGFTYFQAGEPIHIIMYIEWTLGIIGVLTLVDIYREELSSIKS